MCLMRSTLSCGFDSLASLNWALKRETTPIAKTSSSPRTLLMTPHLLQKKDIHKYILQQTCLSQGLFGLPNMTTTVFCACVPVRDASPCTQMEEIGSLQPAAEHSAADKAGVL